MKLLCCLHFLHETQELNKLFLPEQSLRACKILKQQTVQKFFLLNC